jgi:hypothetical protein
MKKLMFSMFLAAVLLLPMARAGTLALDFTGGTPYTNGNWSLGWEFTVNSPITVDGLAYYDDNDGQSHEVGIYDSSEVLLVSTNVTTADCPVGTAPWCVQSVTPTVLGDGTYYIVGVSGADDYAYNPSTLTTIP